VSFRLQVFVVASSALLHRLRSFRWRGGEASASRNQPLTRRKARKGPPGDSANRGAGCRGGAAPISCDTCDVAISTGPTPMLPQTGPVIRRCSGILGEDRNGEGRRFGSSLPHASVHALRGRGRSRSRRSVATRPEMVGGVCERGDETPEVRPSFGSGRANTPSRARRLAEAGPLDVNRKTPPRRADGRRNLRREPRTRVQIRR